MIEGKTSFSRWRIASKRESCEGDDVRKEEKNELTL